MRTLYILSLATLATSTYIAEDPLPAGRTDVTTQQELLGNTGSSESSSVPEQVSATVPAPATNVDSNAGTNVYNDYSTKEAVRRQKWRRYYAWRKKMVARKRLRRYKAYLREKARRERRERRNGGYM